MNEYKMFSSEEEYQRYLIKNTRNNAIKEFAKKVKESKIYDSVRHEYVVPVAVIDWTEQEMVGEE